jgi:polar amino acid transport system substrate-binding protein
MKQLLHLMVLLAALSLTGCNKETQITDLSALEGGKTFAVPTGTVADKFVLQRFPDAKFKYFNSVLDCALAVKGGKADAAVYDKPVLQNLLAKNAGLTLLPEMVVDDNYGFAVQMANTELKNTIDQVLADLKSSGKYADMMNRWLPEKGSPAPMPVLEFPGTNGVLKFGTAATTEPMSFVDGSRNVVGFDVEFASYIAQKLGKKIEVVNMDFGALLPALMAGKVDIVGAGLSITEERAKSVLFSKSYYPSGLAAAVKASGKAIAVVKSTIMTKADDIADKKIGVLLGSVYDGYSSKTYPNAKILQYQNIADLLVALQTSKVDGLFHDQSAVPDLLKSNPDFGILAKDIFFVPIGAGFNSDNDALREQFNVFLKEIKSNGIYNDMIDRWMTRAVDSVPAIPVTTTSNGTLKAGVVNDLGRPYGFIQNGELNGFDIELSKRFAAYCGKKYEPVALPFGSLIASLSTNKIDMITASMFITEEREKQIDFGDPYSESGASLIVRKADLAVSESGKMKVLDDIADKKVGVFTGTVHDGFIARTWPKAQVSRFESTADLMLSVKTGKIDAAMFDLITARLLLKHNPDLGLLSDKVLDMPLGVGFSKKNPELTQNFNDFLKEIKGDGTYDVIYKRWFVDDAEQAVMPVFENPKSGKILKVGVSVDDLPYVAFMNGDYVGFDIEMIKTFAKRRGYQLEITTMEFPSLVAALAAGKVEMVSDGIAISEERGKQIDFSDSYALFRTAVIATKSNLAEFSGAKVIVEKKSFLTKLSDSFYSNIILEKRYLLIIDGLILTILISFFAAIFGTMLGGLICFMKMSKNKLLSGIAIVYISLLRGTPVLVLLMIIYYIVFASVNINPALVAVFAFGLNFAAYVSEMFRTSIQSIDPGQNEAGIAGGFTKVQTFIHIIAPQALRHLLPVYKGEFISLVKMTSIVGYIAVQDLTKASDIIRSRTFDAFFPLIMAAVLYLIISWLLTWALGYVEVSVDPKRKRITRQVEAN